jgi:hypothetical protein
MVRLLLLAFFYTRTLRDFHKVANIAVLTRSSYLCPQNVSL